MFTTTNIENIYFDNKYVYFIDGEYIKRYSDYSGIRKIAQYEELKFNDNIRLGLYIK